MKQKEELFSSWVPELGLKDHLYMILAVSKYELEIRMEPKSRRGNRQRWWSKWQNVRYLV